MTEEISKQMDVIEESIPRDMNLVGTTANRHQKSQLHSGLIKTNEIRTTKVIDFLNRATGIFVDSTIKIFYGDF